MAPTLTTQLEVLISKFNTSVENWKTIQQTLEELRDVIYIGNERNNSILSRLVQLEDKQVQYQQNISQQISRIEKIEATQMELQKEDKKGRWQLIAILTVSIVGWLGVITTKTNVMPTILEWIR